MGLETIFLIAVILYGIYEASKKAGQEMWLYIIAISLIIAFTFGIVDVTIPIIP